MQIQLTGRVLTASAEDRTITGLLLPYGEPGSTNVGKVTAGPGSVTVPDSPADVRLNLEHEPTSPLGAGTAVTETPQGLTATFSVARTRAGDDALEEARTGLRAALSVEIDNPVIRGGRLVAGLLTGAGLVVRPAFPSAQLVASDHGDDPDDLDPDGNEDEDNDEDTTDDEDKDTPKMNARLSKPARRTDPAPSPKDTSDTTTQLRASEVFRNLAGAGLEPRQMVAALDQVTQADAFDVAQVPQYLGELWSGVEYVPEFTPLVGHADLTSAKMIGWRFAAGKTPQVGDWSGPTQAANGTTGTAQVPSNEVKLELVEKTATRLAAGWNVDRIHRDFPNPEFWSAFFRLANESYAMQVDAKVKAHLLDNTAATAVLTLASLPAGVSQAAGRIVKGMLKLKATQKGKAQWAILGEDLYEQWLLTRAEDALAYLTVRLGLGENAMEGIEVVGTSQVPAGTCRVGVRNANTLHELGGASPLRVSSEDLATGNLTEALYGYYGLMRHDAAGVVAVTTNP